MVQNAAHAFLFVSRTAGHLERTKKKYQTLHGIQPRSGERCSKEAYGIGVVSLQMPFAVLATGVAAAVASGLAEAGRRRWRKTKA